MNPASILDQSDARLAPATRDDGALRAHVHGSWAAVATAWGDRADYVDARVAGVTERLLEVADIRPGERVLELACGPGGAGLDAAEHVGPGRRGGHLRRRRRDDVDRGSARGGPRARERPHPGARPRGDRRARRLLRRGAVPRGAHVRGRPGPCGTRDPACPASGRTGGDLGLGTARAQSVARRGDGRRQRPDRPADPSPRRSGAVLARRLRRAGRRCSRDAGLADVVVGEQPTPLRAGSFEQWWETTSALAGPLSKILADLPEPASQALQGRLRGAIRSYETRDRDRASRSRADRQRARVAASRARRSGPDPVAVLGFAHAVPLEERKPPADDASVCSLKREGR